MNIQKIHLRNVKSYADETLSFKPGINIIGGANGSGKTTIIESIGYGLFGRKPDYTFEEFVRRGAKDGSIEIWFEVDDVVYRALRTFTIKQSGSWDVYYAESNRRLDLHGDEDIKKWLRESLHLESDDKIDKIFENVVGIEQGQFAQPFLLPDRKRKDYFEPVLKLDKYRNAYESTASVSRKFGDEIKEIEHKKELNSQRVESYDAKVSELSEIKIQIQHLDVGIKDNNVIREGVIAELKQQEGFREKLSEIKTKLSENNISIQSSKESEKRIRDNITEAEKAKNIVEETKAGKENFELSDKKIKELEAKHKEKVKLEVQKTGLEKEIEGKNAGIVSKENSFKEEELRINKDISNRREEIKELTVQINVHGEKIKNVLLEKEKSDASGQFIEDLIERKKEIKNFISEFEKNKEKLEKIKNCVSNYGEIRKAAVEYGDLILECEDLTKKRVKLEQNLETQGENLKQSEGGKCPFLDDQCKNIKSGNLEDYFKDKIEKTLLEIKELNEKIKNAENRKSGLEKFLLNVKNELKKNISEIRLKSTEADKELVRLEQKKKEKEERIIDMEERLGKIENEKKKLIESRKFLESQKESRERLIKEIESYGDVDAEISKNKLERDMFKGDYDKYIANLSSAGKLPVLIEEKQKVLEKIEELDKKKQELDKELNACSDKYDERKLEALKEKKAQCDKLLGELNNQLTERKKDEKKLTADIESMNKIKEIIIMQEKELEKTKNSLEVFNFIRSVLNQIGPKIAGYYLAYISDQAGMTYRAISGENVELIWDENYNIILKDHDKQRIFKQLSGGEQMTAAIAVRLAILKQFSKIRLGFFDEPTTHLDEERRSQLAETIGHLKELEKRWFDQLFVISHDDAFETITENVVVLRKNGGVSVKA